MQRFRTPRVIMLIAFAATSAINYLFSLAAGWLLLPGDFGLLAFAQTLLLISGLLLNSGVPWFVTRVLLASPAHDHAPVVRGGLVANSGLALALTGLLPTLYILGPLRSGLESGGVVALVAAAFVPMALLAVARGVAQGMEHFSAVAVLTVAEIATKAVAGVGLVRLGFGAAGAIAGFALGAIIAATFGLLYLWRSLAIGLRGAIRLPHLRSTLPLFGSLLGLALILNLDLLALKLVAGDERILTGYYQAGIVLANLPYYLVTAALVPILFTQLAREQSLARGAGVLGETLGLTATLILPIEFILILVPGRALAILFPAAYAPGAATLQLLAIGNAVLILVALLATAYQAIDQAQLAAKILLATAVLELFALAMAVPLWQGVGAASVFIAAAAVALVGLSAVYLREVGWDGVRGIGDWLRRYLGALAVGGVVGRIVLLLGLPVEVALALAAIAYARAALALRLIKLPARQTPAPYPVPALGGED